VKRTQRQGKRAVAIRTVTVGAPVPPVALPATAKPMTKGEREDLQRLIRRREQVLKSAAGQRSAELLADFEQQLASVYHYDQDQVWAQAYRVVGEAAREAAGTIAQRCEELGIPSQFAPSLELYWHGRGQNAVQARRNELIRVAKSRIAAEEKKACVMIEMQSVELQSQVIANGLTSDAARSFLDNMPAVETLMPRLDVAKVEGMLESRGVNAVRGQHGL
jgi:hypothetical protein